MRRIKKRYVGVVFLASILQTSSSCSSLASQRIGTSARDTTQTARASSIADHMSVLADDSMSGRATGSPGYDAAARYVARQFERAGASPVGRDQWLQPVPLLVRSIDARNTSLTLKVGSEPPRIFAVDSDFVLTQPRSSPADIDAQVISVGFGLTVPEWNHDDYGGLDVRGKIVAFIPGSPASFSRDERVYYETTKIRNAAAHGAIAAIRLWTPAEEKVEPWTRTVGAYRDAGLFRFSLGADDADTSRYIESIWAGPSISKLLLDSSTSVARTARLTVRGASRTISSANVIGVVTGSDPRLRNELVAVTAHLDHLGIAKPVRGDSIYNGAIDNASGVAAVIELARMFATTKAKPKRSLVFIAFTAEEPGSLGSEYFVRQKLDGVGSIVANVNIDGISMWPFDGIVPRGAEHSTIAPMIEVAAQKAELHVAPDPTPMRYGIGGSDQYSFMTHGIPAVIVASTRTGAPRQLALDWVNTRYHAPGDDMNQPLDFDAAAKFTDGLRAIVFEIANSAETPRWNEASFFRRFAFGAPR
jgi:hypothetical protein